MAKKIKKSEGKLLKKNVADLVDYSVDVDYTDPDKFVLVPYKPRDYQTPLLKTIWRGLRKRACCIWHRRAGKDITLLSLVIGMMMHKRVGIYYYFFPTYSQGKKILWRGIDGNGKKLMDYFPKEMVVKKDEQDMMVELKNGSLFQIIGTDNIDSIVGTNPVGVVFSEYSLQNPSAWNFIRPILAENGGWAVFNYTPRGQNHGYKLYNMAKNDSEVWFTEVLTVDDTNAISKMVLEQEEKEIISETGDNSLYLQEYYCDFNTPMMGSYYAKTITQLEKQGRLGKVPYDPMVSVDTWWDLGVGDSTVIWFTQSVGQEIRVIDYLEASGEGLAYYAKELQEKKYVYGTHNAPHDIAVRELGTGRSRLETAANLGIYFKVVPKLPIDDGIQAVRGILQRCWFDAEKCEKGIDALRDYHKEWNDVMKVFKNTPAHNWASHAADAFRTLAVGHRGGNFVDPNKVVGVDEYGNEYGYDDEWEDESVNDVW